MTAPHDLAPLVNIRNESAQDAAPDKSHLIRDQENMTTAQSQLLSHYEDYPSDLRLLCFDFFYWFSRFEFALKENGYITRGPYNSAMPDWGRFIDDNGAAYTSNEKALQLLRSPPKRQVVRESTYAWQDIVFPDDVNELQRVVLLLKTIRNNLFHGGKHGLDDWDNPTRTQFLVETAKLALDSLATLNDNLHADYERYY